MEIRTLVYVGTLCIVLSIILYFYINLGDLLDRINEFKKDILFMNETNDELKEIDDKIKVDLEKKDTKEDEKVIKKELEKLKKDEEKEEKDEIAELKKEKDQLKKTINEYQQLQKQLASKDISKNEVFLVRNNIFKTGDGPKVCKGLFNAKFATKDQLNESYNNGANWCNYGWASNGNAYYPLQNDVDNASCSGTKGLNGGKIEDKDYKLGVLCYGVKPDESKYTNLDKIYQESSFAEDDIKMLEDYRKRLAVGGIKVAPFNDKAWSQWSYKNDTMKINNTMVISSEKDSSKNPQNVKPIPKSKIEAFVSGPSYY